MKFWGIAPRLPIRRRSRSSGILRGNCSNYSLVALSVGSLCFRLEPKTTWVYFVGHFFVIQGIFFRRVLIKLKGFIKLF